MASNQPNFSSLPAELQLMVMQELANVHNERKSSRRGIAAYASVCKNWQAFFEPMTFKHFILRPRDLADFRQICQDRRRMRFVRHIWMRLEEPSPQEQEEMSLENTKWSKPFFTDIVFHLWNTLSDWRLGEVDTRGLTLELSAHKMESDRFASFAPPDDLDEYSNYLETGSTEVYKDDNRFYYPESAQLDQHPSVKRKLFCKGIMFDNTKPLPELEVVSSLLTRRANTRGLRPEFMASLFNSLPRLRDVRLERWRLGLVVHEDEWLLGTEKLLPSHIPASLKSMAIFEELSTGNRRFDLLPKDALAKGLVLGTLHLESLSVCFFIEAADFFQALLTTDVEHRVHPRQPRPPDGGYGELASLTLTSSSLNAKIGEEWDMSLWISGVKDLLLVAAVAAKRMPKLRLMELWNSKNGTGTIFRYEVGTDGHIEICWQSTLDCNPFDEDVVQAWRDVASAQGNCELKTHVVLLLEGDFQYLGSAIAQLKSREAVLHPVSLAQIK